MTSTLLATSRLLDRWMAQPLLDLDTLNNRQNCVHEFVQAPGLATDLQNTLKQIRDLERILGRLQNRIQNPRELGGIRDYASGPHFPGKDPA